MTRQAGPPDVTPESFGRDVLGPIVAEFCLRLWSLASLMERRDDTALLFCARGGLRMQLAYERFLAASGLPSPVHVAPLMVSRVVAVRPSVARTALDGGDTLLPVAAGTLTYEFRRATVAQVALALSGTGPTPGPAWDARFSAGGVAELLRHPDGRAVTESLVTQAGLFRRHLDQALAGRRHAVVVDTGLYGSTGNLLAEGLPDLRVSSALFARSFRPGPSPATTTGLSCEAEGYSPAHRRTALLRYWHFVEWLFEPELSSVRSFTEEDGEVRSNLEVPGWQARISAPTGSVFAGIVDHLDNLGPAPAARIVTEADRAWTDYHRAVVWPTRSHGAALSVGTRTHDFGTDRTWGERPWTGALAAMRGSSMWRGGEVARSGTRLRLPLLAVTEGAYGVRHVRRRLARLRRHRPTG